MLVRGACEFKVSDREELDSVHLEEEWEQEDAV